MMDPSNNNKIDTWVRDHSAEELAFLSQLIQIPSESRPPTGYELECQQFVEQSYRAAGAVVDVFTPAEVPGLREHPAFYPMVDGNVRVFTNRPDVVGRFRGSGDGKPSVGAAGRGGDGKPSVGAAGRGGDGRSLLFSTHVDTVPAGDAKAWKESGPFSGAVKGGKLFGRGSWDTKWGIAASLFAIRCVRELGIALRGDVIIESVVDEEFGGSHGALAARLRGYNADVAINSEPTSLVAAPAHRGGTAWKIIARGDPGRAFAGQALGNPVVQLAFIIQALQRYDQARTPGSPPRFYEADPALTTYIQQIGGGGTTFADGIGMPAECYAAIWTEEHPGTDQETHTRRLVEFIDKTLAEQPGFEGALPEFVQQFRYIPGSMMDPEHGIFRTLRESFDSTGLDFCMDGAKFACDTYVFNLHSPTPALTLGPRGGNAHAPDEYVQVQDVIDLTRVYARVITEWCE